MHISNIIDRLEIEIKLSLYKSTMIKGRKVLVITLINVVAPKGAVVFWLLKEPFVFRDLKHGLHIEIN